MELSPFRRFILKNAMMMVAFVIGLAVIGFLQVVDQHIARFASYDILYKLQALPMVSQDFRITVLISQFGTMLAVLLLMRLYEAPIRRCIDLDARRRDITPALRETARRRILNEPYFVGLIFAIFCLVGVVSLTALLVRMGANSLMIRLNLGDLIHTFVIGATLGIALMVTAAQWLHVPYFFPDGGLLKVKGAKRVGLRIRFTVLWVAVGFLPLMSIIRMQFRIANTDLPPDLRFMLLSNAIWFIIPVSLAVSVLLSVIAASHITGSMRDLLTVLRQVARGIYSGKVCVTSNDELGYAGDVINEMTAGLQERDRMQQSLNLAMAVQRNLLPDKAPVIEGLDIAGASLYCDETGGDYFDYIWIQDEGRARFAVVLGDVSGHGISSALLMASARACLRQRSAMEGSPAAILTDLNRQMAVDVEASGSFMTMMLMVFEPDTRSLRWVRAGHEPAVFYDPRTGAIEALRGPGMALGVDVGTEFHENRRGDLLPGQILLLSSDGLWEAQNARGEMLGRDPIYRILKGHAGCNAQEILDRIIETLVDFQQGAAPGDDVTLVVVKTEQEYGSKPDRMSFG